MKKHIFVSEETANGFCFKDIDAYNNQGDKVCYIPESTFTWIFPDDMINDEGNRVVEVDDEKLAHLIFTHGMYTANSIKEIMKNMCTFYNLPHDQEFISYMADEAIEVCDWQSIETWLGELDFVEEYEVWFEDKNED